MSSAHTGPVPETLVTEVPPQLQEQMREVLELHESGADNERAFSL